MIDLHSHILPGIDDGAKSLEMALDMARIAVADGTKAMACTPHILAPIYNNTGPSILAAIRDFEERLKENGIPLRLISGADVHIAPDLLDALESGAAATLNRTRYFLFEPPHNVMPPGIDRFCAMLLKSGYLPILTHPERLSWIERNYDQICVLDEMGVAIQLTAGSIVGAFGKRIQYWSDRMLDEGRVDIVASDAHDTKHRPPLLSPARDRIIAQYGAEAATRFLRDNPLRILKNATLPGKERNVRAKPETKAGLWGGWARGRTLA